jgi:hypothetical protein
VRYFVPRSHLVAVPETWRAQIDKLAAGDWVEVAPVALTGEAGLKPRALLAAGEVAIAAQRMARGRRKEESDHG